LLANKYGHFTADGKEYVIVNPRTPRPWVNVVSNGDYGFVVSQTGGGFSWRGNAEQNRLTRLYQDLIKDNYGKYFYLRDRDSGRFWSLSWMPTQTPYETFSVRHGVGYSVFEYQVEEVHSTMRLFVVPNQPLEIVEIAVTNRSSRPKRLDLTSYFEWEAAIHPDAHREFHKLFMDTAFDPSLNAIKLKKYMWGFGDKKGLHNNVDWDYTGFHAVSEPVSSFDTDKESFLGMYGREDSPKAMREERLAKNQGRFGDPVASLRNDLALQPGETKTIVYTIGCTTLGKNEIPGIESVFEDPDPLIRRYTSVEGARTAFSELEAFWAGLLGGDEAKTPDPAFDIMTNTFAKYQAISGRLWAKTGYYQTSGGYGFRDQLQDCQIFLEATPELAKKQLRMHAAKQFQAGDVYHWFVTFQGWGPRGNCSDDLLWLPFILDSYLEETLDFPFLDEKAPFLDGGEATIYEHAKRAIQKSLTRFSAREVPLMGSHDWNDGLSAVGPEMKGESFWMSCFLYIILKRFSRLSTMRGDDAFAAEMLAKAETIRRTFNEFAWDGEWYRMATTDAGLVLGSKDNDEGKIFLMPNAWAIIGELIPADRLKTVVRSMEKLLLRDYGTVLNYPAFTRPRTDVGYVTRYAPGLRENGGVYTHAATWAVTAFAKAGRNDLAYRAFRGICPPNRTVDPDRYVAEPYVTCGNSDGPISPNYGRGGWTWYTGSAQWLHRVAVRDILGVKATYEGLAVEPHAPSEWNEYRYRRIFRGAVYEFQFVRGLKPSIVVDGAPADGILLPDFRDGRTHQVRVVFK